MPPNGLHRFQLDGRRFALDPETCFCFECDEISWDVLEYYPETPITRIVHLLKDRHDPGELEEVVGELEWLRATKSILPRRSPEDLKQLYTAERGLKRLSVALRRSQTRLPSVEARRDEAGPAADAGYDLGEDALHLLFSRSGQQNTLCFELVAEGALQDGERIGKLCKKAFRLAQLAEKSLTVAIRLDDIRLLKPPIALEGHMVSLVLEMTSPDQVPSAIREIGRVDKTRFSKLARVAHPDLAGIHGRVILRPNHPHFEEAVPELYKAGFRYIELDLEGSYAANQGLQPGDLLESLKKTATYYAESLVNNRFFRLEPIAGLFWRIYEGKPLYRHDPAGTNELAVDADGAVYPSLRMLGTERFKAGSILNGALASDELAAFDNVGSVLTGACRQCWARYLCGGGSTAVHDALSGSFRKPYEPWCDAQRDWIAHAIAAFNLLSSHGVNFSRMYQNLEPSSKPSFFSMVRTALKTTVAVRPIEESDAPMLVKWENWSEAAYFLHNETGLLLATQYDREMDSLHPLGLNQELMLVRKSGEPFGLIKFRPLPIPGAAHLWVFMKREMDAMAPDVRKGFRALLEQVTGQQAVRHVTAFAAAHEEALMGFYEAAGFHHAGTLREAMFLHGSYSDVHAYALQPS